MRRVLLVFLANELDQLGIEHDLLVHGDRPGFGVGLRVVDRDLYIQVSEIGTTLAFNGFRRFGQRTSLDIEPSQVAKSG